MESLINEFKSMAITSLGDPNQGNVVLAKRPDAGGKNGRAIQLLANVYRCKFKQSPTIAHYDVSITVVREEGAPPATGSINRDTSIAVWDALVASNPDNLGKALQVAGFDNRKNAFCLGKLNFPGTNGGGKAYQVELPAETDTRPKRRFEVKFQLAQLLDLSILETFCAHKQAANLSDSAAVAIMALDVLLRHSSFRRQELVTGAQGRKFLDTRNSTPLGEGAHVLAGLFASVRPTATGMVVNLDSAFSPYIVSGQLKTVCNAIVGRGQGGGAPPARGRGGFRGRGGRGGGFGGSGGRPDVGPFSMQEIHELKKKLKGAKVRVTHRKDTRPFMIDGFGQPAGQQIIHLGDKGSKGKKGDGKKPTPAEVAAAAAQGKKIPLKAPAPAGKPEQTMTVAEYFVKQYGKRVDADTQVVVLRGGQMVPMECLELLNGCVIPPTKLSASQATNMINVAAQVPQDRRKAIEAIRRDIDMDAGSRLAAWGVQVEKEMLRLNGRVLNAPKVQYAANSQQATPFVGAGSWDLIKSKFLKPSPPMEHWAVAVYGNVPQPLVEGFFGKLIMQMKQRGMAVRNERPKIVYWDGREDTLEPLRRACNLVLLNNPQNQKQVPPQMVFVLLQDPKRYDDIKKKAAFDLPVALPTQVLLIKKLTNERGVDQYCGNVSLKLNAKLGGVNSTIVANDLPGFNPKKTLMLGADVTHPTGLGTPRAGLECPPSLAGVVSSVDGEGMKYAAQVREQEGRKEFITDLEDMTEIHVRNYMQEMKGIKPDSVIMFREGVSEGQYGPVVQEEVTSLKAAFRKIDPKWNPKLTYVVCAKRHHTRFFAANEKDMDRTGNLPPGLVVDTTITHPFVFDFFLQAHAGLKGTAKPTRYICLLDENGFGSDQLQKLVNSLCYSFARATRSVSLVPVAYYADIVAGKARSYVSDDDASTQAAGARAPQLDPTAIQRKLDRQFKGHKAAMGAGMWWM
ncbi:hypothetical protein JCM10207_001981 [Rhodosporidiobolus poonsookiae]